MLAERGHLTYLTSARTPKEYNRTTTAIIVHQQSRPQAAAAMSAVNRASGKQLATQRHRLIDAGHAVTASARIARLPPT
jgi:hypothetical protein